MAREILFKAKRTDNGEWVEGFYFCMVHDDGRHVHHFIMPLGSDLSLGTPIEKIQVEIDINTLCQYTGLTDKNGNKIWENDVVKGSHWTEREIFHNWKVDLGAKSGLIIFKDSPTSDADLSIHDFYDFDEVEVIGNIFDNPELLNMTS